ncbi:MAG: potassium/proton antiporter [Lentisphaeria bacterium]|nr:potassium/proton antiporter [Lentisphaeria bacterium]
METHWLLTIVALFLLIGVFSSKISSRFQFPALLMFLLVGLIVPSEDSNLIHNYDFVNFISAACMSFILFSGGLDSNLPQMKRCAATGIILASIGVILTTVFLGCSVKLILPNFPLAWCLLLASVVSSTDAAAVFGILRGKGVSLKGNLAPLLELESGSNDPIAAFMTLFMISVIQQADSSAYWFFIPQLIWKIGSGIAWGYVIGRFSEWLFNKLKLEYEGLYYVINIAVVLLSYGGAECLKGNGFMASYIAGLTMSSLRFNYKRGVSRFSDGLAWLCQVMLFMVLGLLMDFEALLGIWWKGLLIAASLMFVARPLAVLLSTVRSKLSFAEKIFVSWVGLRGAAPIVLATFPLYYFKDNEVFAKYAGELFTIIFFVVITSVVFQGKTLMFVAKKLHLDSPFKKQERNPLELEITDSFKSVMKEFNVTADSEIIGKSLAEIKFPTGVMVVLIRRNDSFILARGESVIARNDGLLLLGDGTLVEELAMNYHLSV